MRMFYLLHWLIILAIVGALVVLPAYFAYLHGKKVGELQGYMRGFKEGQANRG